MLYALYSSNKTISIQPFVAHVQDLLSKYDLPPVVFPGGSSSFRSFVLQCVYQSFVSDKYPWHENARFLAHPFINKSVRHVIWISPNGGVAASGGLQDRRSQRGASGTAFGATDVQIGHAVRQPLQESDDCSRVGAIERAESHVFFNIRKRQNEFVNLDLLSKISQFTFYDNMEDESEDRIFTAVCLVAKGLRDFAVYPDAFKITQNGSLGYIPDETAAGNLYLYRDSYPYIDGEITDEELEKVYCYNVYDGDLTEFLELANSLI